jgi:hypothetical protein
MARLGWKALRAGGPLSVSRYRSTLPPRLLIRNPPDDFVTTA